MLTLSKFGRGREDYFLSTVASSSPSTDRLIESDGTWLGTAIDGLASDGLVVDEVSLSRLFDGRDPTSGEFLDPLHHRVRVAGFDCVFAAPKSVSLLHALGSPEAAADIGDAHTASVEAVMAYLEKRSVFVRRSTGGDCESLPGNGIAAAAFVHRTSRTLDPHLHTHVLVANLACDNNGKWSALDARGLFGELRAARLLYGAQLRHEMSLRFSLDWSLSPNGFGDIAGLSNKVLHAFSLRSAAIAAERDRLTVLGSNGGRFVGDATRPDKRIDIAYDELVDGWKKRAYRQGLSDARVADLLVPRKSAELPDHPTHELQWRAAFDRDRALVLSELSGKFSRSDLVGSVARGVTSGSVAQIEREVDRLLSSPDVVARGTTHVAQHRFAKKQFLPLGRELPVYETASAIEKRVAMKVHFSSVREMDVGEFASRILNATDGELQRSGDQMMRLINGAGDPNNLYQALFLLNAQSTSERRVIAVTSNSVRGAHLEAMTGIETITPAQIGELSPRNVVMLESPERMAVSDLAETLKRTSALGCSVVIAELATTHDGDERRLRPQMTASPAMSAALIDREMVGDVAIHFVASPKDMREAIARVCAERGNKGDPVIVMAANRAIVRDVPHRATSPKELRTQLKVHHDAQVVVVGSARVLGSSLGGLTDQQRAHIVVGERILSTHRGRTLEIAEPKYLRQALGRAPLGVADRATWREAALTTQRSRRMDDLVREVRHSRAFIGRELDYRTMSRSGLVR